MKFLFYSKNLLLTLIPRFGFNLYRNHLENKFKDEAAALQSRIDYYCKVNGNGSLPEDALSQYNYKLRDKSAYFYDLKEYLYYFPKHLRFTYYFGDRVEIKPHPTLYKARPIDGENQTSVLFKLNKVRHFKFIKGDKPYSEKKDMAVFRGKVTQKHRIRFMEAMFDHPLVDAGQSNKSEKNPEWKKPFMSVEDQLDYKFLICIEGNDVASNLKWAMSSNSIVVTPRLKFETWFMEGTLEAGKHYIEVKDDWSDFDEKINYYLSNPAEAQKIIENAHQHVNQFKDRQREDYVCIKTLEKYLAICNPE